MTDLQPTDDAAGEWRSARLLHQLYTTLAREFAIDLPVSPEVELVGDNPAPESVAAARAWLNEADGQIPVHQLRNFLQTSSMADAEHLQAILDHHLHKPQPSESDRDKTDFLLVQFFSICAPSPLEDPGVSLKYVARILEPVLGEVDLVLPEALEPLEALVHSASACRSLQELFRSGILDKGRKLKCSPDQDYFAPIALVAFARFNFLMRRSFFTLMHQDLSIILDGLRELEQRGVTNLDCRSAEFSADEPVGRLRMICQSWKVMFQAEYSSGQPLRLLADLRAVIDTALARSAGGADRAMAAAASPASSAQHVSLSQNAEDDGNGED
jgi:hypothetical protein